MIVLVVGNGGREHALAWKISRSPLVTKVLIAPGNAGTAEVGENIAVKVDDIAGLVALAKERAVGLVVIGPEGPLVAGLADALAAAKIPAFGPSASSLRTEFVPCSAYQRPPRASQPRNASCALSDGVTSQV